MRPRRDRFEHVAGKIMRTSGEVVDGKNSNHRLLSIHESVLGSLDPSRPEIVTNLIPFNAPAQALFDGDFLAALPGKIRLALARLLGRGNLPAIRGLASVSA